MWSQHKRRFYRQIGYTAAEVAQKEAAALTTKQTPESALVTEIYRLATNGRPISSPIADAARAILAKQTKAPPAPHAPIIARLMQRSAALN